ncbi:MAG: BON domain-containing protein [Sedimentisphaerales bacterium]|nr:BON domain-containing protein [Sedimentisphaerales bacterium]
MKNSNTKKPRPLSEMLNAPDKKSDLKHAAQVSSFIDEGNPNTQKLSVDQQAVQEVKQAIKDDPSLAPVAKDIQVTVKDGDITLDGKVSTDQQMNRAAGTAIAVGAVDEVNNRIEATHKDKPVSNKHN